MESEPLDAEDLERVVDQLFERSDARIHAVMHAIARLAVAEVIID